MQYPITFQFKTLALAPQITATDSSGAILFYVRQKMFKLKEKVEVFVNPSRTDRLAEIAADRILDFSANYSITDSDRNVLGNVRRKGMRSLWKASYEITSNKGEIYTVREKSALTRVLDGFFCQIPVLGMFSGYCFHPEFLVTAPGGETSYTVRKMPALFEGRFQLEKSGTDDDDILIALGLLMMLLLERTRG